MKKPAKLSPKAVLSSNTLPSKTIRHSYLLTLCYSSTSTALGEGYVLLQPAQSNKVFRFPSLAAAFDYLSTLAQPPGGKTVGDDP